MAEKVQQLLNTLQQQPPAYVLAGLTGVAAVLILGCVLIACWLSRRKTQALKRERDAEAAARQSAELANRAKAQFLANMSHEIRTPMNAIVGFTDLALKSSLSDELREHLDTVRASADWLMHIVSDAVEFSRIGAGRLQLDKTTFSLADCIRSTIKIVQPEATAKRIALRYKIDAQIPNLVCGDPMRLRQILFHLLDNAVKFTTSGSVVLMASLDSKSSDAVLVRISVADTGIGISLDKQKTLFDAPGANEIEQPVSTSGLGLTIARRLVEMMGGTIEFTSQLGAGTTFQFTAWFEKVQRTPELDRLASALNGGAVESKLSVLVAEDNAVNRRLIVKVLESAGHRVVSVANGKEALSAFATEIFDLVLMDMEMPDMDGLEATRNIRLHEPEDSHLAIYALTAHASASDRDKCLAAGMDGFMSKPLEIDDVLKVVARASVLRNQPKPFSQPVF